MTFRVSGIGVFIGLYARCSSCCQASSVKATKETRNPTFSRENSPTSPTGLVRSSSTAGLLKEWLLLPVISRETSDVMNMKLEEISISCQSSFTVGFPRKFCMYPLWKVSTSTQVHYYTTLWNKWKCYRFQWHVACETAEFISPDTWQPNSQIWIIMTTRCGKQCSSNKEKRYMMSVNWSRLRYAWAAVGWHW